jgi:hypothetical protein
VRTISADELKDILAKHLAWLRGEIGGTRANLSRAYLSEANLSEADLSRADLSRADLTRANLSEANLSGAYLSEANLSRADLSEATLGARSIVPPSGAFEAWKKLSDGHVAHLLIPADAKRMSSLVGRKCRASKAKVLAIYTPEGKKTRKKVGGIHDESFTYRAGQTVTPDEYNDDIRIECSNGIHFFLTREEAAEYA